MSNSSLVNYVKLSPNRNSPRNHKIDTITIHHMSGNCSIEALGDDFARPARGASSNYAVGTDGRIAMYVPESDRAWTSSSRENDHRAITIEVANDVNDWPWTVSDKAMASLVQLLTDICERNGIPRLLWQDDPSLIGQVDKQNMTIHKWFANTDCPGPYLHHHMREVAQKVNEELEWHMELQGFVDKLSNEEAYKILQKAQTYLSEADESEWSDKEGYWDRATNTGVVNGKAPQDLITREQTVAILGRMGLIK